MSTAGFQPPHWPTRQTVIRLTMLAFACITILVGAVVVGQEHAAEQAVDLAIGRDTPVRITVWIYGTSVLVTFVAGWKASKWDSARGNKIENLEAHIKALEEKFAKQPK